MNFFTSLWMSGRLSDWFHFLNLRLDSHAQEETRFIAGLIAEEIRGKYPKSFELWDKYARGPLPSGCIQTP